MTLESIVFYLDFLQTYGYENSLGFQLFLLNVQNQTQGSQSLPSVPFQSDPLPVHPFCPANTTAHPTVDIQQTQGLPLTLHSSTFPLSNW